MPVRRRHALLAAGIAVLVPTAARRARATTTPELAQGYVDRMPAFWAAYDASRGGSTKERANALLAGYFLKYWEDFRRAGIEATELRLQRWLARFDPMALAVRALHAGFGAAHLRTIEHLRGALGDFAEASTVTVLPSLFSFDGHLEPHGDTLPLFFGLDGIVLYHGADANLDVLLAHELFHVYQFERNPSMALDPAPPVFASLWMEGVATYASEQLNPTAGLVHVLLDDVALAAASRTTLQAVAKSLLEQFDAVDETQQARFFGAQYRGEWPARSGYHVGLLLARQLGQSMSLGQLAALPTGHVRQVLRTGLRKLAAASD